MALFIDKLLSLSLSLSLCAGSRGREGRASNRAEGRLRPLYRFITLSRPPFPSPLTSPSSPSPFPSRPPPPPLLRRRRLTPFQEAQISPRRSPKSPAPRPTTPGGARKLLPAPLLRFASPRRLSRRLTVWAGPRPVPELTSRRLKDREALPGDKRFCLRPEPRVVFPE